MLAVALVISGLVRGIRREARAPRRARTRRRDRADPQHAARLDLARPAHPARRDDRRVVDARGTGRADDPRRPAARSRKASTRRRSELADHVDKVLQMTRLETGTLKIDRDWASLAEIVGVGPRAAARPPGRAPGHRGDTRRPAARPRRRRADRAGARQSARELREAYAARHGGARARASAKPRARSSPSRTTAKACRTRTSSACSRSSTTARCLPGAPISAWASRSAARSCACTPVKRGPSAVPGGGTAFRFSLPDEDAARGPARERGER